MNASFPVGKLVGVFGIRGELKLDAKTSSAPLFILGATFWARPQEREVAISAVREHKGRLLIKLLQAPDIALAETFVGATLYSECAAVRERLSPGEVLDADLIGTKLGNTQGDILGEIVDVLHYPSSSMLVVGPQRIFVPYVKAFIVAHDVAGKTMTVDLPEGLLEGDAL